MTSSPQLSHLLEPTCVCLVVVDVQNDYCHPGGALGRAGLDLDGVLPMCATIEKLRDAARRSGVPVVFVMTEHSDQTDTPAWRRRSVHAGEICRAGSWGSQAYAVAPGPDDVVVIKHRYSGFVGTRLEQVLRSLSRTTLVVTGTATNVCVESTVRDARMRDFDVVVVEDAVTASDGDAHTGSLENIRRHFGPVVPATSVIEGWSAVSPSVGA